MGDAEKIATQAMVKQNTDELAEAAGYALANGVYYSAMLARTCGMNLILWISICHSAWRASKHA
jgi:hypothetical protein